MLSTIKALPRLVAALTVAGALTFGATQALADDPPQCTGGLPPHTCKDYPQSGVWCPTFCGNNGYPYAGECNTLDDCCVCLEK